MRLESVMAARFFVSTGVSAPRKSLVTSYLTDAEHVTPRPQRT
jgi:hypothetical protein